MADDNADRPVIIRRVITGHDANDKAIVVMDGPATNYKQVWAALSRR